MLSWKTIVRYASHYNFTALFCFGVKSFIYESFLQNVINGNSATTKMSQPDIFHSKAACRWLLDDMVIQSKPLICKRIEDENEKDHFNKTFRMCNAFFCTSLLQWNKQDCSSLHQWTLQSQSCCWQFLILRNKKKIFLRFR